MRVVIANPYQNRCAAEIALVTEGVTYEVAYVGHSEHAYGEMLAQLWRKREPFVLVEHDIAPWAGAIEGLSVCPQLVCGHRYPRCGGLTFALGLLKVSGAALDVDPNWEGFPWWQLDGQVFQVFADLAIDAHIHEPPVAHLKADL